jgi:hypothetical protein
MIASEDNPPKRTFEGRDLSYSQIPGDSAILGSIDLLVNAGAW